MTENTVQKLACKNPAAAIGVFDSGIGGLSVLDNLCQVLPDEQFVYLADTAFVPYGEKSPEFLAQRVREIFDWLIEEKQVKAVALACNTSCKYIPEHLPVPVLNPIDVAGHMLLEKPQAKTIGVIATIATVDGGLYPKAIQAASPDKRVYQSKAVGLVNLIEGGLIQTPQALTCLEEILSPLTALQMDALVLGCTHYPFATNEINQVLRQQLSHPVELIDPADGMGKRLKQLLDEQGLSQGQSLSGSQVAYYATGNPQQFLERAKQLPLNSIVIDTVTGMYIEKQHV